MARGAFSPPGPWRPAVAARLARTLGVTNPMPTFAQLRNRWALQVGRFILAFGEIEQQSFVLWRKYYGQEKPPANFKARTQKILGKMRSDQDSPDRLRVNLIAALRIADKRNAVAHHPMCLQVFQHTRTGEVYTEWAIDSELADDYVSAEDLARLISETRKLVTSIHKHVYVP